MILLTSDEASAGRTSIVLSFAVFPSLSVSLICKSSAVPVAIKAQLLLPLVSLVARSSRPTCARAIDQISGLVLKGALQDLMKKLSLGKARFGESNCSSSPASVLPLLRQRSQLSPISQSRVIGLRSRRSSRVTSKVAAAKGQIKPKRLLTIRRIVHVGSSKWTFHKLGTEIYL